MNHCSFIWILGPINNNTFDTIVIIIHKHKHNNRQIPSPLYKESFKNEFTEWIVEDVSINPSKIYE